MVLMGVLGWLQRRNVLKRSVCRFTAECINTIPKGKVASPWDLNVQIKSCVVLQNETGIHDRRQSASEEISHHEHKKKHTGGSPAMAVTYSSKSKGVVDGWYQA